MERSRRSSTLQSKQAPLVQRGVLTKIDGSPRRRTLARSLLFGAVREHVDDRLEETKTCSETATRCSRSRDATKGGKVSLQCSPTGLMRGDGEIDRKSVVEGNERGAEG